jgi:uncharacterized protein involved in cysteine biosynthesis
MFADALKALQQIGSPPFRSVLLKSVSLAVLLLIGMGVGLHRLFAAGLRNAGGWVETSLGGYHMAVDVVQFVLALLAGLGVAVAVVFLMPAITALVASVFSDEIAAEVERTYYPHEPAGQGLPLGRAIVEGLKTAGLALLIYLCAVPFLLIAGLGAVVFFFATAFLLGREYFELVAMRFLPPMEAKALRKRHAGTAFTAGMIVAAFVSIPVVNLATPLFATAFMVHIFKRLPESRRLGGGSARLSGP